ncbi:hypothetical protein SQ11_11765 [Nitrosospira sp. NpAV]|nr:hypothetical protein SQ11_11765 [Nitrosospira sp. NpAV]
MVRTVRINTKSEVACALNCTESLLQAFYPAEFGICAEYLCPQEADKGWKIRMIAEGAGPEPVNYFSEKARASSILLD